VIISSAGGEEAKGRAFGVHAALDQLGAVTGVVMATAMLYSSYEPQAVFKASLIPGLAALLTLYIAYRTAGIKPEKRRATTIALTEDVILFGLAQFFLGLSTVHISLSMYRFAEVAWMGSLLYLVAMITEVLASPALGYLADKKQQVSPHSAFLLRALGVYVLRRGGSPGFVVFRSRVLLNHHVLHRRHRQGPRG